MHSPGAECPTAGESSWGGLSPLPRLPHQHCSGHKLQKEKGRSYYPKLETLGHISSPPKKCCACLPPALQPPVVLWRVSNPAHVLCVDLRASCPAIPLHSKKKKSNTFCTGKYETARLMNRDCIDFHAYYSTQLKGSVCPFRSVPVVQLPGKHLQMKLVLNRLHAWGFVFVFFFP